MMSLAQIADESARAARKAARAKRQPYLFEEEDRATVEESGAIPSFGNYVPKGWELVETYFVDSSGFGNDDEPAMTIDKFIAAMKPGYGYAVIESGEFQVYIGEFKKL